MRRAAIVMPMRTPVGLPGGALAAVAPHRLIATALSAAIGRSGLDPARVDHVVSAVDGSAAVRAALPLAGLSPAVSEFAIGPGPGSGLRALVTAAMMVQTGAADVVAVVGAGTEIASEQPEFAGQEALARRYDITRADADALAASSHRRTARAYRQGIFGAETAPVVVHLDPGDPNSAVRQLVDHDETLRDDVSTRGFAVLEPLAPEGIGTAGNSSAPTLAASACLVVAEERLADLGLEPMGYLLGWTTATGNPGVAVPATALAVDKVLSPGDFRVGDMDLVEIDETTAVEVLALTRFWESEGTKFDADERLNVNGGAIALGDPGGAAGLRVITTLLHELSRRAGGYGLATMPAGANQALAVLFETPHSVPITATPRGARFHGARPRRFGRHRA